MHIPKLCLLSFFTILLVSGLVAQADPVYDIQVSAVNGVNITLNEDCQSILSPRQLLLGDFDADGDGNEPANNQFRITVQDDDPSNGPIVDGCGSFVYTIDNQGREDPTEGLVDILDPFGNNWSFGTISREDPTNQQIGIFALTDNETLVLRTAGNLDDNAPGSDFALVADYTFPEAGILSFDFDFNGADPGVDFVFSFFDFNGTFPLDEFVFASDADTTGTLTFEGEAGTIMRVGISDDGFVGSDPPIFTTLVLDNFRFTRPLRVTIGGFVNGWGFINAEDKTSPTFPNGLPVAPAELFCSEIDDVNVNELPANVSRCWIVDGESSATLDNSMDPRLRARLLAGGGIPVVFDGCSDVEICVHDVVANNGPCDDLIITRRFTATDGLSCTSIVGATNDPTVASYDITFTRPDVDDVVGVPVEVAFNCTEFPESAPNPLPNETDYPFLQRADGSQVFLRTSFCNIGAVYEDSPRSITCENTYKFVRTYTVIDWCDITNIRTFQQIVKVGDFAAPTLTAPVQDLNFDGVPDSGPLFFSTNTTDCSAFIDILGGVGVMDNCDSDVEVVAFVYPNGDLDAAPLGPYDGTFLAGPFPLGTHTVRYLAEDNCENVASIDVDILIEDRTAPVAICENGLDISVGGNGTVELCAVDVDRAPRDDCSELTFGIARVDADNNNLAPYADCITLTCDELGVISVGLQVTDAAGNSNLCWLDVLVEDKASPICIAPSPITVTCQDLAGGFPDDLDAAGLSAEEMEALLDTQFGAANGVDNCPVTHISQTFVDGRTSCGTGMITRNFTVKDGQGLTSPANACRQIITVLGVHDYTIVFPADAATDDCVEPEYAAVTFEERGCDLITVAPSIDTFTATADECYKLRITYEVLNWCAYNTEDDAYSIPRDADGDNNFEEATWLHLLPRNTAILADDIALLDQDNNLNNNNWIAYLDEQDADVLGIARPGIQSGSSASGYGLDGSRGAFTYQQFVKVYDDVAPSLMTVTPAAGFCDEDGDCVASAELNFTLTDDCSPAAVSATAELDAFTDAGSDGVYTLADFVADGPANALTIVENNGNYTIITTDLPLGNHAVRIVATDGCGNTAVDFIEFEIIDCKAPTPICINGLTATLMPDGTGGGMSAIWAIDFIASPSTDCAGTVDFAIYRATDAAQNGFLPDAADTGLDLTCDDLGMLPVRIYAIDPNGQFDYCETAIFVQANDPSVCIGSATIAGNIHTEAGEPVAGVEVSIAGTNNRMEVTDNNGNFSLAELPLDDDYTLVPYLDRDHINGVSTVDLLIISQHILDLSPMTNPLQLIAADANRNREINVIDLIVIRKVILGLEDDFDNNASWRFIDGNYTFPDPTNPWLESFPTVVNFNNLAGNEIADFMAVKIGDVNGDADPLMSGPDGLQSSNPSVSSAGRSGNQFVLADQRELPAGELTEVAFYASTEQGIIGLQGTFQLTAGVELVEIVSGQASAGQHFGQRYLSDGLLTFSFERGGAILGPAEPLFTLRLRSDHNISLEDALQLNDRITRSEAYTSNGGQHYLTIDTDTFNGQESSSDGMYSLAQNSPNPFAESTQINYTLPVAGTATLVVQDIQGRIVMRREVEGVAGQNRIEITRAELKGAAGVLTYTLTADDFTATRKMVVR